MNMTRSNKSGVWVFTVRGEPDMDRGGAVPVLVAIFHQLMLELNNRFANEPDGASSELECVLVRKVSLSRIYL